VKRLAALALGLLATAAPALAAGEVRPIVIGQSLPLTGPAYPIANRIQAGTRALLERLNAAGGLAGRPLEVVTLDDAGDRQRLSANLQRLGVPLAEAYRRALQFTGKVVVLVGFTLAAGVATWALSPIKFQADMGILLAFMFLWNMVGALVLLPALARFMLRPGQA